MSKIIIGDVERDATAEEIAELDASRPALSLTPMIHAEVHRRIIARASANTQMNMVAERSAGRFSAEDEAAYNDALDWIADVRAKGRDLITAQDPTFADDSHWPEPSAAAIALAERF